MLNILCAERTGTYDAEDIVSAFSFSQGSSGR